MVWKEGISFGNRCSCLGNEDLPAFTAAGLRKTVARSILVTNWSHVAHQKSESASQPCPEWFSSLNEPNHVVGHACPLNQRRSGLGGVRHISIQKQRCIFRSMIPNLVGMNFSMVMTPFHLSISILQVRVLFVGVGAINDMRRNIPMDEAGGGSNDEHASEEKARKRECRSTSR